MAKKRSCKSPQKVWEELSSHLVHFVEGIFFQLGVIIARKPWQTVIVTWLFVLVSAVGLLNFNIEKNPMKLWVPPESDFFQDTNWYIEKFGSGLRYQKVLITAEDVLQPKVLATVSQITRKVNSLSIVHNNTTYTIKDLCLKVPVINFLSSNQSPSSSLQTSSNVSVTSSHSNNNIIDYSDPTLWLDYEFYCGFLKNFPYVCLQQNLVDIWKDDINVIENVTKHDIVKSINSVKINPLTGHPMDYSKLLGGIKYDESGDIVTAESLLLTWYAHVNMSEVDINEVGNLVGTEDWVSIQLAKWEGAYLELMHNISNNISDINVYYEAGRSFGDISGQTMFQELDKLFIGIILMFVYIQFALSRCNWLEIRLTLGGIGLMCVGMAYITSIGWCSALGVPFGPVHSSLPFLLMGLGVDDMFVMKACWEQLSPEQMKKSLPFKVGLMLKHAGVSIVITSFTDIVALLIGAITILPSLKSFCIYAAMGVFFIFCYSVTYYVAVFTLDIRRIENNRNGILFCYKHANPVKVSTSKSLFQRLFSVLYKKIILTTPVKIIVIIFTLAMTGFSIEAVLKLEQRFDPNWFIPDGTYYNAFLHNYHQYYPEAGNMAMVFLGEMEYHKEFQNLHNMVNNLKRSQHYVKDVVSWVEYFQGYVLTNFNINLINSSSISDTDFRFYLSRFLFSPIGGRFQSDFQFSEPLQCGHPASNITASSMSFDFPRFHGPNEYLPAMNFVKKLVKSTEIETGDGYRSVWSKLFANWVTDEVIGVEVERNIELALLCVMVCTFILITNIQMCLWIFMCVLVTIVNVLGWMQRWGMTVDIVCCIGLELAIGLCVDYAAHVGHTFLTITEGTRQERALKTVTSIGTAVLLGGGSTLLSLSLLSMSKAYTFKSFFKIFLLVIIFGLFNGLIFLPAVLSLIGPSAYKANVETETGCEVVELNGKSELKEKHNCDDLNT